MRRSSVIIPPVVVLMLFVAIMWYMAVYFPFLNLAYELHYLIPVLIAILGFLLICISSVHFYKHNTTLNPLKPELASTLIKTGLYQYSRNPIYCGLVLILIGWGVYLLNLASIFCVILFVSYLNLFQIIPEEKSLAYKFGNEFEMYKRSVNRWI